MLQPREVARKRHWRGQIVALAVVWAVGVIALLFASGLGRRQATDAIRANEAAKPATRPSAAPAADDVTVDVARVRLDSCRILAVAFRSRDEGWVTDFCGQVFHTTDGGVTFAALLPGAGSLALTADEHHPDRRDVGRIEWLSDRRGLAFVNGLTDQVLVMVSTDGGATWPLRTTLPLNGLGSIYASAHVGETVWGCGGSVIIRSRDGGATFRYTRHTPFNHGYSCTALSFLDDQHGWAGGMDGKLYETLDGGDSWTRLRAPWHPRPPVVTAPLDGPMLATQAAGVALVSPREGWVAAVHEHTNHVTWASVTRDGGRTWVESKPSPAIAARLAGGGVWGDGDRAVMAREGRLAFYRGRELMRETPLVGAGKGPPVPESIRGREPLQSGHLSAWTDHAIVESFDDGRSWSTVVRVADGAILRRVVHPVGRRAEASVGALIELTDGRILHESWHELLPSDQPELDRFRMDWTEAHRRGAPPPASPLNCLASAATGSIELRGRPINCMVMAATGSKDLRGGGDCEFSRQTSVRLTWDGRGATLTLPETKASYPIPDEARRRVTAALAAAGQRPDDANDGCTEMSFEATWRCGAAPPVHASFREYNCEDDALVRLLHLDPGPAHRAWQELQVLLAPSSAGKGRSPGKGESGR